MRLPSHFRPEMVSEVWRVPYEEVAQQARSWATLQSIGLAHQDTFRIGLLLIDVQNTFCIPGFELFVEGSSGTGAVGDNQRLCSFIYGNLGRITKIVLSLDTHDPIQIFHSIFLINEAGRHPTPFTVVSRKEIEQGVWRVNPDICAALQIDLKDAEQHIHHYTRRLEEGGKHSWTIWPYHALQGSIGRALVSAVEEAVFFHSIARTAQPLFVTKGNHPLTESYSILGPEVRTDQRGVVLQPRDESLTDALSGLDMLIVAGQAKSHCLAWTVEDIVETGSFPASRLFLLEDCTSPVFVPGLLDYTEEAENTFRSFENRGVHLVKSSFPIQEWPGLPLGSR